ncbi:MAG TPA: hypothetical protein DEG88_02140 [Propionibacteriaceae bacterium]|jgi:2-dehydro-3-deoxyphosphogluconate aldolase/(4S)-4-hydroxy-2-oxoglutarate aldolase|nr:hypothetical protein [Propionibacteriaceae bacterium]HBY22128.1 hypothetical protein [Propionibacteriaceae bacterium]
MMGRMASLVDALQGRRLLAEFPTEAALPQWLPAAEVLIQEGIRAWAFPLVDADRIADALRLYGRRARIGVYGLRTAEEVREAAALGVQFLTSPVTGEDLIEAAGDVPFAPGAMTPNEIHRAEALGATTVHLVPADALGMAYGRALALLFPGSQILATGRLERYQCEMLLESCASAVGLQAGVLFPETATDAEPGPLDLEALRRRAQEYGTLA